MPYALQITLICLALVLMCAAVALVFVQRYPASVPAYAGMLLAWVSGFDASLSTTNLLFWGIAMVILVALHYTLPRNVALSRYGITYMGIGAVCGTAIGMVSATVTGIIVGAVAGTLFGALIFSRTPAGKNLNFPSRQAFNYILAKGLPLVYVLSMVGLVATQLLVSPI